LTMARKSMRLRWKSRHAYTHAHSLLLDHAAFIRLMGKVKRLVGRKYNDRSSPRVLIFERRCLQAALAKRSGLCAFVGRLGSTMRAWTVGRIESLNRTRISRTVG
jgi:hypothetical protein